MHYVALNFHFSIRGYRTIDEAVHLETTQKVFNIFIVTFIGEEERIAQNSPHNSKILNVHTPVQYGIAMKASIRKERTNT